MVIRVFAASVLAKPLDNAQIVRGVFCLFSFEYGETSPRYIVRTVHRPCSSFLEVSHVSFCKSGITLC